jgi:hypothetical protein
MHIKDNLIVAYMEKGYGFRKTLLGLIFAATIIGSNLTPSQRNTSGERSAERSKPIIKKDTSAINLTNSKKISKLLWTDVSEYDSFVRSTVDKYYASDIKEIYDFYNIKKDFPKYGFKFRKEELLVNISCEGAMHMEDSDSIYFYSSCSKDMFRDYAKFEKTQEDSKEKLTKRIHHYIKHEAGHSFYSRLKKELGKEDLVGIDIDSLPKIDQIQYKLVKEGVADYISYKGEIQKYAKDIDDTYFKKMIKDEDDFYLYELGFKLVKPILDINFQAGIKELINHPLTKKDLKDLPAYRERRIENISK